ncbi:hypothetical protein MMC11_004188 [Xylographa trunciseda]|nr:hypothetical protein [Xylographa trunciseda]
MSSVAEQQSEASSQTMTTSTSSKWYDPEIGARLPPSARSFYLSYSGISDDKLDAHLHSIRERAWNTKPYPCLGQWAFLSPRISRSPAYTEILAKVKGGASILDLGCCLGQDLRFLAAEGAPTDEMYASDLVPEFWNLGYELFRDKGKFKARFYNADIFDRESSLQALDGRMDIVYLGAFLHLFDWNQQLEALKAVIKLSKVGTIVAGRQIGHVRGTEISTSSKNDTKTYFLHNPETMARLWVEAEQQTGTKWTVRASTELMARIHPEKRDSVWMGHDARALSFEAVRQS